MANLVIKVAKYAVSVASSTRRRATVVFLLSPSDLRVSVSLVTKKEQFPRNRCQGACGVYPVVLRAHIKPQPSIVGHVRAQAALPELVRVARLGGYVVATDRSCFFDVTLETTENSSFRFGFIGY